MRCPCVNNDPTHMHRRELPVGTRRSHTTTHLPPCPEACCAMRLFFALPTLMKLMPMRTFATRSLLPSILDVLSFTYLADAARQYPISAGPAHTQCAHALVHHHAPNVRAERARRGGRRCDAVGEQSLVHPQRAGRRVGDDGVEVHPHAPCGTTAWREHRGGTTRWWRVSWQRRYPRHAAQRDGRTCEGPCSQDTARHDTVVAFNAGSYGGVATSVLGDGVAHVDEDERVAVGRGPVQRVLMDAGQRARDCHFRGRVGCLQTHRVVT